MHKYHVRGGCAPSKPRHSDGERLRPSSQTPHPAILGGWALALKLTMQQMIFTCITYYIYIYIYIYITKIA